MAPARTIVEMYAGRFAGSATYAYTVAPEAGTVLLRSYSTMWVSLFREDSTF
jgi:hypothetical protein